MAPAHQLVLDSDVRDWVFIPLTLFIVLMKLVMQYVHQAMSAAPPPSKELLEVREMQAAARSARVRAVANMLPEGSMRMRKDFFADKDHGCFSAKPVTRGMHETMVTDPSFMADMMKKNLTGMVPQILMGTAVTFFFSGFVMGRVPFGLSPRFRPMLQRGVDLASLDVSYFTGLSYYILLLFASRGPFSLVFREDTLDDAEVMRRQMGMGMAPGGGFDAAGVFKSEKAAWEANVHEWALEGAERDALKVLRRRAAEAP
ncbi:ER membrane complex subunit 3-like [Raphidocelis subcapitata]|uniref:ER membrane protein complex subunit 3 n=1 Tax=Raphidocelis subcapitata TaxID=307507 RepID=A0A2V0PC76_9CHLO|nr:ER membrane complex subunit 3-like [Raphidocelis subcapitata]|eukprot:GBF95480.1 ER membrane complex subunit 3-like [Raphidocelis subcapitata]